MRLFMRIHNAMKTGKFVRRNLNFTSRSILLIVLANVLWGFNCQAKDWVPNKLLQYKTVDQAELKLHIFTPEKHSKSDNRPAIIFFFGGGWIGGTPEQFYPHCEYFASRGMVAISAEYRVQNKHGTTPRESVKDAKSAIRWVRKNARNLGINPDQLIASGGSAGGHIAAAAGLLQDFNELGEDITISSKPAALVLFNPVIDNGPHGYGYKRVKDYWKSFSPLHNISESAPPTIIFLGTDDKLIPVATVERYKKHMLDKKRRCEVHLYKGQQHGFFNYKYKQYFNQTVIEADKFLASLGYLRGEPELQDPN